MTRRITALTGIAIATAAVVNMGCTEPNPAYQPGADLPGECRAGDEVSETFEDFERPHKLDLWFVISDADAMTDFQRSLSRAVEPFLLDLEDADLDLRVAVSTMDATRGDALAAVVTDATGCADNTTEVAESGDEDWASAIRCNLQQGASGDRRARPFDVTADALVENPASLSDFRRDQARLLTIMVSNQDDCSGDGFDDDSDRPARNLCAWQSDQLRDVDDWVAAMQSTTTTPEGFSLAAIAGSPTEVSYETGESVLAVCSSTLGSSYPSPRLSRATKQLGSQGLFLSSCIFDFYDHLDEIAHRLARQNAVTLCTAEPIAHEPLEVLGIDGEGNAEPIPFGTDFIFPGATDDCPDGAIELRRDAARDIERLELTYCAL